MGCCHGRTVASQNRVEVDTRRIHGSAVRSRFIFCLNPKSKYVYTRDIHGSWGGFKMSRVGSGRVIMFLQYHGSGRVRAF